MSKAYCDKLTRQDLVSNIDRIQIDIGHLLRVVAYSEKLDKHYPNITMDNFQIGHFPWETSCRYNQRTLNKPTIFCLSLHVQQLSSSTYIARLHSRHKSIHE